MARSKSQKSRDRKRAAKYEKKMCGSVTAMRREAIKLREKGETAQVRKRKNKDGRVTGACLYSAGPRKTAVIKHSKQTIGGRRRKRK